MKILFITSFFSTLLFSFNTWALDGCYQMYVPGGIYPAFCISGSMEEGIAGRGTKVAIFDRDAGQKLLWCDATTTIVTAEGDGTLLNFDPESGIDFIKMSPLDETNQGDLTLSEYGSVLDLKYLKIDDVFAKQPSSIFDNEMCP